MSFFRQISIRQAKISGNGKACRLIRPRSEKVYLVRHMRGTASELGLSKATTFLRAVLFPPTPPPTPRGSKKQSLLASFEFWFWFCCCCCCCCCCCFGRKTGDYFRSNFRSIQTLIDALVAFDFNGKLRIPETFIPISKL